MPEFSVVMPVYNKIATLSASLASLYRQTFHDFEVIAVDDGSTDGSLEVLHQDARAGRLRLFQRDAPGPGGHEARNFGARQARADWLVFFDADDMLLFDHLARFADAIADHPGIDLFVNAYQKMVGHQRLPRVVSVPEGVLSRYRALAAFARCDFIHVNGACLRRDRFEALHGFPEGRYRQGGDVYFWLKALCELEAMHYDPTVTSLWQPEHSALSRDPQELHPAAHLPEEITRGLSWRERRQLHAAVNRKVLSWAVEKRYRGQSVRADLRALKWNGMRFIHCYHVVSLLMPWPHFDRMQRRIDRTFATPMKENGR